MCAKRHAHEVWLAAAGLVLAAGLARSAFDVVRILLAFTLVALALALTTVIGAGARARTKNEERIQRCEPDDIDQATHTKSSFKTNNDTLRPTSDRERASSAHCSSGHARRCKKSAAITHISDRCAT